MRKLAQLLFVLATFLVSPAALARVQISVDLSTQTMHVQASDGETYSWPVSSARAGYVTPRGVYSPTSLQSMHYSRKYDNSPMPHSIFFDGGYAIHGTYETRYLGRPVSHGCVRISPANAARLFSLVREEGATIRISGSPPFSRAPAFAWRNRQHHDDYYAGQHHPSPVMSYAPARQGFAPAGLFGGFFFR